MVDLNLQLDVLIDVLLRRCLLLQDLVLGEDAPVVAVPDHSAHPQVLLLSFALGAVELLLSGQEIIVVGLDVAKGLECQITERRI